MSTSAVTIDSVSAAVPRRSAGQLAARVARGALSLSLLAIGVFIVVNEGQVRVAESHLLAFLMNRGIADSAVEASSAGNPAVAFELGGQWLALRITIQCAIALYLGPVLLVAALLVLSPRVSSARVLLSTGIGLAALTLLNQLRLLLIAFGYGTWGTEAFHWMHGPVGTGLMLVGIAAVLFLFVILCIRRAPRSKGRRAQESQR
ncbi:exosortase/archaeosortase family protein [Microterricola gilva]|uniref:Exosortase/archaeosortase family protein n=1 Tax=Microterricola gilva TaxID=393267 RepID=A0A4Q8AMT5_9MICO|nr:exosortase R [Microterricola gilva]RZU65912.1 exosortase/archaeosortase family protein [Microterricola gilva]